MNNEHGVSRLCPVQLAKHCACDCGGQIWVCATVNGGDLHAVFEHIHAIICEAKHVAVVDAEFKWNQADAISSCAWQLSNVFQARTAANATLWLHQHIGCFGQCIVVLCQINTRAQQRIELARAEVGLNVNKIQEVIKDYYATLNVLDFNNVIAMLFEILTGFLSIQFGSGNSKIGDFSKFEIFLQRILGLCFDSNAEIDVAGAAKTSELDEVDESFFEFTSVDLFQIEDRIDQIHQGVLTFQDCDNFQIPVEPVLINETISNLIFVQDPNLENVVNAATSAVVPPSNSDGFGLRISFDLKLLKSIPKAILFALFSPKILLPIMVMLKALGSNVVEIIKSLMDFGKRFIKLVLEIMSQIGGIFIQELFKLIKQDLQNLIQAIILDVTKETSQTRLRIILRLVEILLTVARLIKDWRQCKSVVDEILQLLKIAISGFGDTIPKPLLVATKLLSGYSASRAFVNTIEEYQKIGLPTGPMPDGSPNLGLAAIFAQLTGNKKEEDENSKVEGITGYGTWVPGGIVMPMNLGGKKI